MKWSADARSSLTEEDDAASERARQPARTAANLKDK